MDHEEVIAFINDSQVAMGMAGKREVELILQINALIKERNEWKAKAEALCQLNNCSPAVVSHELKSLDQITPNKPSRLQIAAMIYASRAARADLVSTKSCLMEADELIKKEGEMK